MEPIGKRIKSLLKENVEINGLTKQYILTMIENAFDSIQKDDIIVYDSPLNKNINFIIMTPPDVDVNDFESGIEALEDKDVLGEDNFNVDKITNKYINISVPREKIKQSTINDINIREIESKNEKVYIEFLNKEKNFKKDKKYFNSYEEAVKWARDNFEKFHPDMIKYETSIDEIKNNSNVNQKKFIEALADEAEIDISSFDMNELLMGFEVEKEHGTRDEETNVTDDDPIKTLKISIAHLKEIPDYYTKLKKYVENGGTKEGLDEEKKKWKYNPWAVCTDKVGRKDKEKYEKCVMGVKDNQLEESEEVEKIKNKLIIDKNINDFDDKKIKYCKDFILDCRKELGIKEPVKVILRAKRGGPITTTASYDLNNHDVNIYAKGRHIIDILRSIAHELKHMDQNLNNRLNDDSGKTGSVHENEANSFGGIMIRNFGKKHKEIYE